MKFMQTNLNDHYILRSKNVLQITDENAFDDENAYSNKILFYFDWIRIEQEVIIF
jgi:6-phosphogluconolactonase/glucosamine-6-phosphate isomerase/deaminase